MMARRGSDETTEQAKPSEVRKMPGKGAYSGILSSFRKTKKDISEIGGVLSGEIKAFVEKFGYNRKALRHLSEMDRMEPEKLADYLECIDHGREAYGLNERAASVQKMQFAAGEGEEEEGASRTARQRAAEKAPGDGKVKAFPRPTSVAAE